MTEAVKRSYRSAVRDQAAARTRLAVREAAVELFVANGYVATTVRQIASAAGVATRTVFNAFPGGKSQIFDEALDAALGGDERRIPLNDRAITKRVAVEDDAERIIEMIAADAAELYERAGALISTYHASAGADPHMRRHADLGAREASKIMRRFARALDRAGALAPGRSTTDAADILLALASPQVHQMLCHDRGWTTVRYRRWLAEQLRAALLEPPSVTAILRAGARPRD